jgi:hypothetical protein
VRASLLDGVIELTSPALAPVMHPLDCMAEVRRPDDPIGDSRRLRDASRRVIESAKRHVDASMKRLDRARNILQLVTLRRALRERLRRR